MKKIRILKEMPYLKVGEIHNLGENGKIGMIEGNERNFYISSFIEEMISAGFAEYVKTEETLEDKFRQEYQSSGFNIHEFSNIHNSTHINFIKSCEHGGGIFSIHKSRGYGFSQTRHFLTSDFSRKRTRDGLMSKHF